MQNTRLNGLVDRGVGFLDRWLQNPWRRISLIVISLLFGNFLASATALTTGQRGDSDVIISVLLVSFTELISWIFYSGVRLNARPAEAPQRRSLVMELSNALKIGLIYGFFVEAFKLGS